MDHSARYWDPPATGPVVDPSGTKHPDVIYRFLPTAERADALAEGRVWVTTLDVCRTIEDPVRRDAEEATSTYRTGALRGDSTDAAFVELARRGGGTIGPRCTNISLNVTRITDLVNSWVLCTTLNCAPQQMKRFGDYCVEIRDPFSFFWHLGAVIHAAGKLRDSTLGPVRYAEREHAAWDPEPGPIGFVKPRRFADEGEFRMIWIPEAPATIVQREWRCPAIQPLVRRIA